MNNNITISFMKHSNTMYFCPYCKTKTSNYVTEFARSKKADEYSYDASIRTFYSLECMTCNNSYFICEDTRQKQLLKTNNISSVSKELSIQWGVESQKVIFPQQPNTTEIPSPSKYMPDDVRNMYEEAANVFSISLRSSAALIRLTLELLLKKYLVNDGEKHSLNEMIGMLSTDTPSLVTEFMDLIRNEGNVEVHPELEKLEHKWGDITREPDKDEIVYLFKYINTICNLIGLIDKANTEFESLPEKKKKSITRRNQKYQE